MEEEQERQKRLKSQQNVIERLLNEGGIDVVYMIFEYLEPMDILWLCSISDTILAFAQDVTIGPFDKEAKVRRSWFGYAVEQMESDYFVLILINKWKSLRLLTAYVELQDPDTKQKQISSIYSLVAKLRLDFIRDVLAAKYNFLKAKRLREEIKRNTKANETVIDNLLEYFRVNPADFPHDVLSDAARTGNLRHVTKLLKAGADPSIDNYNALRMASRNNHLDVVRMLLSRPLVDLKDALNVAYSNATDPDHDNWDIVRYLLTFPDLPNYYNSYMLTRTVRLKQWDLVEDIITHPNFAPTAGIQEQIPRYLIEFNKLDLLKLWIENVEVQDINSATWLPYASSHGQLEIVKFLFTFSKSNVEKALYNAVIHGHYGVVKYILEHTDQTVTENLLEGASENEHFAVLAYLLQQPQIDIIVDNRSVEDWFEIK